MSSSPIWFVPPAWSGQTCFIIGGGVSAETQPIERLAGRRTIALNSSYLRASFAEFLLFGDSRWYEEHHGRREFQAFAGQVVSCAIKEFDDPRIWRLRRLRAGLAQERDTVLMRRTVMAAGMNLAAHLGVARIVALGLDGGPAPDGRTHHHEPHPWPVNASNWAEQRADLASLVEPLAERGIAVVNASPGTALDLWPVTSLQRELS
jgi:hypothetical protein